VLRPGRWRGVRHSTLARAALAVALAFAAPLQGDGCACNHAAPASLEERECSLCLEAEKQSRGADGDFPVFFLKDASPRKPNRTLALPVRHGQGQQDMRQLTPAERALFWKAAMAKAQQLWPDAWGLAVNADTVRTQCHMHIHIGKLNDGMCDPDGLTVATPDHLPAPASGCGIWLHPVPGGLHVHLNRDIAEPVLMR